MATIETASDAKKAGPGTHRVVGEPQGFYLKVDEATGNGSFFLRFRLVGKRREYGLGCVDTYRIHRMMAARVTTAR